MWELYGIFVTGSIEIKNKNEIPMFGKFSALSLIVLFYLLNVYWMILIIERVYSVVISSNDNNKKITTSYDKQGNDIKSAVMKKEK